MIDPQGVQDSHHVEFTAFAVLKGDPVEGIALLTGHSGRAVVQDANRADALVVNGVHQRRQAGMGEGGIADDADDRACSVPLRASSNPWAIETDAPMSSVESMAAKGGKAPRV